MEHVDSISSTPGKLNIANVLTKLNSHLTDMLQLTIYFGRLQIDIELEVVSHGAERNLGYA